jgi:hypothetical protein
MLTGPIYIRRPETKGHRLPQSSPNFIHTASLYLISEFVNHYKYVSSSEPFKSHHFKSQLQTHHIYKIRNQDPKIRGKSRHQKSVEKRARGGRNQDRQPCTTWSTSSSSSISPPPPARPPAGTTTTSPPPPLPPAYQPLHRGRRRAVAFSGTQW